jgi:hypothetical protein
MTVETGESRNGLLFLIDPEWRPTEKEPSPPITALIGAWRVTEDGGDGTLGRFQPNPIYLPSTPDSPLDPVDAVLRALARGECDTDQVAAVMFGVMFGVALDDQGKAIVARAPDGAPSVLVATAHAYRDRVTEAASWRDVTLPQLARALPPHGVDVLINPGARTSMRVQADAFRAAATRADDIGA